MRQIKETNCKKTISTFIIIGLFLFTRLINLNSLPVFVDEAIYVRWSQIIKNVETLRFIPLTDGKQPLFMWLTVPLLSFVTDPLIAGRLVSILSGFINLCFVFLITNLLLVKTKRVNKNPILYLKKAIGQNCYPGLLASFLYIITPFGLFFDRLATPDNLLTAFVLASIFLAMLQTKFYRLDLSLLLGTSLGLAWLTKTPALYYITIITFSLTINSLIIKPKLVKTIISLIPVVIAFLAYNLLRLGPQFHMIAIRNKDYVWPISEIIKHPLDPLKPHFLAILSIYGSYVSMPLLIVFLLVTLLFLFQKNKTINLPVLLLFACLLIPTLATASMAKVVTGRYVLTSFPLFIISLVFLLSGLTASQIKLVNKNKWICLMFLLLVLASSILKSTTIVTCPEKFIFADTDTGYIHDWTAGWGLKDMADYLKSRAGQVNVIVGTEGSFGTLPDGLQIYADSIPQLTIVGQGIHLSQIPTSLIEANNYGDEVYLLINPYRHSLDASEISKLNIITTYTRPDQTTTVLYQLKPIF